MRYVYTEKAKKQKNKDKKRVRDYFEELYPEEYADSLIAKNKASRKKAEKDGV